MCYGLCSYAMPLRLFHFLSRTRPKPGAAVRAPGAVPHPHPYKCNYVATYQQVASRKADVRQELSASAYSKIMLDHLQLNTKAFTQLQ